RGHRRWRSFLRLPRQGRRKRACMCARGVYKRPPWPRWPDSCTTRAFLYKLDSSTTPLVQRTFRTIAGKSPHFTGVLDSWTRLHCTPPGDDRTYIVSRPQRNISPMRAWGRVCVCTTCTYTHTTHTTTRSHLGFLLKLGSTELTYPKYTTCTTPGLFRAIAGKSGLYNAPNGPSSPPRTTRPGAKAAKKRPWHGFAG